MGVMIILWLIILVMLGVVVAPVGAVSCAVAARSRRMSWADAAYFAGVGALYGVFVTGWVYVLARIFNRSLPLPVMVVVYFLPYFSWVCILTGGISLSILWIWDNTLGITSDYVAPNPNAFSAALVSALLVCTAAVCLFGWGMSLRGLARRWMRDRECPTQGASLDSSYIRPFVYNYVWLAVGLGLAMMVASYMASIGVNIQGW